MADGTGAAERLERLLHILPAASVEGGVSVDGLAAELGVDRSTVLDDLAEATARSYYHPAGSGTDLQISLETDRVRVWSGGAFERPVKLSPLEAFCLALGLRRGSVGVPGEDDGAGRDDGDPDDLLQRVEEHLSTSAPRPEALDGVRAAGAGPDPEGIRDVLVSAADRSRCCRIHYLKAGDPEPRERVVHPYVVAHAEGRWYVVGWCEASEGDRAFRLDRILDAEALERPFERRAEVDVEAFLGGGRVYHANRETEVRVRYSHRVARWVVEVWDDAEPREDGGALVRHRVSDPGWVVRHALSYGGEAEVLAPPAFRAMVRETALAV